MDTFLLDIRFRPSAMLFAVLVSVHIGASACIFTAPLPPLALAGVGMLMALHLHACLHRYWWRVRGCAVTGLVRAADGTWAVHTPTRAAPVSATLRPGSLVHPLCIALEFDCDDTVRRSLVVVPGMAPAADLCRLRSALRFEASAKPA